MKTEVIILFKTTCLSLYFLLLSSISSAQICHGWSSGEIYLSTFWYWEPERTCAIFRSADYGASLKVQYSEPFLHANYEWGDITADSIPGILYNNVQDVPYVCKLMVSVDSGRTWHITDTIAYAKYTGGASAGILYRYCEHYLQCQYAIYISLDTGNTFQYYATPQGFTFGPQQGTVPGELYFITCFGNDSCFLSHSTDGGATMNNVYSPMINMGCESFIAGQSAGEVYVLNPFLTASAYGYHIYRTTNYGQTWDLRYTYETAVWGFDYKIAMCTGTLPGEVYVMKYMFHNSSNIHEDVVIEFSSDSAATFISNAHCLLPDVSIGEPVTNNNRMTFNPNPVKDRVMLDFKAAVTDNCHIEFYDPFGRKTDTYIVPYGQKSLAVDVSGWFPGVYLARLMCKGKVRSQGKIVVAK